MFLDRMFLDPKILGSKTICGSKTFLDRMFLDPKILGIESDLWVELFFLDVKMFWGRIERLSR